MLPQFLGMLLLISTAGFLVVALAVALLARFCDNPRLACRALIAGSGMVGVYGLFWLLGLVLAPRAVLPLGQELSFCGLDCHLHVSVRRVRAGPDLGVTVHFASDAKQAPEWPAALGFRLRDGAGQEYAPSNSVPNTALRAGATWDYEMLFPAVATAGGSVLIVTWDGGIDYLVPGAGNPLVQRQRRLALPAPAGA